jgi:hypothetical protein
MADLKHAKDLQPSYDLALSHNGTEKWADNFAVRMIERIDDLERQLAEAYDALGNVNRGVYLHDHIFALKKQLAEMTADRNLWKDDHDGDCPYKTQLADSRSQLAMKKWPTKYDELMCDPVFRAAYAKEWARTDGDNLKDQLAEAKKLAKWTPITPENLPKEGWEVLHVSLDGTFLADTVEGPNRAAWTAKRWHNAGYSFTRPIAPPQVELRELELAAKAYGKARGV